eukprot:m51a1_g861 putative ras-like gtp-binding protein rho1 (310) ;mRNA; f:806323-807646
MNETEALEFAKSLDWARWTQDDAVRKLLGDIRSHVDAKTSAEKGAAAPDAAAAAADDNKIKLVVVGDGAVGKTCMLVVFSTRTFPEEYVPTVFENYTATTKIGQRDVSLHLWDTAGQEEYDRLRPLSYPGTDVVLLCFSTISLSSYEAVTEKWAPEIKHYLPRVPSIVVGLKTDLRATNTPDPNTLKCEPITPEMGAELAVKIGARKYLEASAKEMKGIDEIFTEAVSLVWRTRHPEDVVPRRSPASGAPQDAQAGQGLPARLVVEEDATSDVSASDAGSDAGARPKASSKKQDAKTKDKTNKRPCTIL